MSLLNKFINCISGQNLFQKEDHLILAVSGGVDSVILCELCHQANLNFSIAHCNFQLREEESERDENFVRSLGEKYRIKVFVKKFDTKDYSEKKKVSIQVSARELRYNWFDELLNEPSDIRYQESGNNHNQNQEFDALRILDSQYITPHTSYLLTAHHANDNVETILMNFFKGTGINGLRGILSKQKKIIRPLLFAKKEELLLFAKENNLSFVEDSSNSSDNYTRNYFRNQIIPAIQKVFPQAENNLINNIEKFKEIEILYQQSVQLHKKKLLEQKGNELHIPVLKLLKAEPLKTIIYEIIKDFNFTPNQTDEVMSLLNSESGKYLQSLSHRILKNRNWLIIAPINTVEANHILINESDKEILFDEFKLRINDHQLKVDEHHTSGPLHQLSNNIACIDSDEITFPLLLRKWKQGDYFYPLGMQKKKKLSKFFIDQKLSLTDKEKIWVIESNKKIIWIIGKRIDNRFKIMPKTKNILELSLS
ncbi:MAG: tRNA lysidine(34) synthetase TilS [Bacteroidota bacterium]|nr:tRNA lysidine(34) synthetase TilS [Bacteroidota bacterium]